MARLIKSSVWSDAEVVSHRKNAEALREIAHDDAVRSAGRADEERGNRPPRPVVQLGIERRQLAVDRVQLRHDAHGRADDRGDDGQCGGEVGEVHYLVASGVT